MSAGSTDAKDVLDSLSPAEARDSQTQAKARKKSTSKNPNKVNRGIKSMVDRHPLRDEIRQDILNRETAPSIARKYNTTDNPLTVRSLHDLLC